MLSAKDAIKKLEEGNKKYLSQNTASGNISPAIRLRTSREGQKPLPIDWDAMQSIHSSSRNTRDFRHGINAQKGKLASSRNTRDFSPEPMLRMGAGPAIGS